MLRQRADSTGATGDRLKEGCAINASLSALGNVISALADISGGKKKVFVPYRNSALTRLLQDALGGNSRTIMIAALSPADVNYDETLSTLRYADRAKKIKNNVVKMENPTDRMIRLLKEENAKLMSMLSGQQMPQQLQHDGESGGKTARARAEAKLLAENEAKLAAALKESERQMADMKKAWEERLKEAEASNAANSSNESGAVSVKVAAAAGLPYLINLHEDPQLSECVVYMFKKGMTRIGKQGAAVKQDVTFSGLGILAEHCTAAFDGSAVQLTASAGSKTFVNGELLTGSACCIALHTGDRVILGNNFVFRFINPLEAASEEVRQRMARVDTAWTEAMDEFSSKQGMRLQQSLGGEMGKLEQEEAQKRKELEEKLAAMEAEMRKEREMARLALEQQKKLLLHKGEAELSEADRQQLQQLEASYASKARNVEEEIAKRREMSERMIQEQMKRKRQTKKVEEQLAALMPLVNEANSIAEELSKPVRFEARLAVKGSAAVHLSTVEELSNLKTLDVTIRVLSQADGNIWTWTSAKFESRLFMMRELYQRVQEGQSSAAVTKTDDPFWDPPEAIEIGKAYVYLKALSQLVEIENEFAIVDYKGDEQGALEVQVFPQGPAGEETDYLMDSKEIVGQSLRFRLVVVAAKGLPAKYGNDVHVSFSFNGESRETAACERKSTEPQWKYEAVFRMDCVTEEQRQYLLKEAAVFEIKGSATPPQQRRRPAGQRPAQCPLQPPLPPTTMRLRASSARRRPASGTAASARRGCARAAGSSCTKPARRRTTRSCPWLRSRTARTARPALSARRSRPRRTARTAARPTATTAAPSCTRATRRRLTSAGRWAAQPSLPCRTRRPRQPSSARSARRRRPVLSAPTAAAPPTAPTATRCCTKRPARKTTRGASSSPLTTLNTQPRFDQSVLYDTACCSACTSAAAAAVWP